MLSVASNFEDEPTDSPCGLICFQEFGRSHTLGGANVASAVYGGYILRVETLKFLLVLGADNGSGHAFSSDAFR
jgi:hypothetical protein